MNGVEPEKYLKLAHFFGYKQFLSVDSAKNENEVFTFKGKEKLKGGIYILVISSSKYYDFIISGNESKFEIEADTTNFVQSVKFAGSKENTILFDYRKFLDAKSRLAKDLQKELMENASRSEEIKSKLRKLQGEVSAYMANSIKQNENTFASKILKANLDPEIPTEAPMLPNGKKDFTYLFSLYKKKYFESIDFTDERMLRTPFLESKIEKYFDELVYQITDSIVVDADKIIKISKANIDVYKYVLWKITNTYEQTKIVGLVGVFVHLAENYYLKDADWIDSTQRAKFQDRVNTMKPIVTGKIMPALILQDTLGKNVNLKDIKAKYTIVYFYRYDCGHCKDHAPDLIKFYEENKNKGIKVFHVGTHETNDPVIYLAKTKEFIKKYNTGNLINVLDLHFRYDFNKNFDIYSTPTVFVLDENKAILGKRIPLEDIMGFITFYKKKQEALKNKK